MIAKMLSPNQLPTINGPDLDIENLPLRDPEELMQPERLGAFWLTRLSFARLLIKRIVRHRWQITPVHIALDVDGRGEMIYHIRTHERDLHFIVFSDKLREDERDDRVIADRWDAAAALCQGELTAERLARLRAEVPRQEYGRADPDTLVWTRGNRSSRFFDHVVASLAAGHQPNVDLLAKGGYIFRSTAFYANTKFGLASFNTLSADHALSGSYQAQMFAAFMFREFACDLAEHIAAQRSPEAVTLDPAIRRYLGIGNATGLGLVPFVINHPHLTHTWCLLREVALARTKLEQPQPDSPPVQRLLGWLERCQAYFKEDTVDRKGIFAARSTLLADLARLKVLVQEFMRRGTMLDVRPTYVWHSLCDWAA
ncbi:MAG: hypothetical protein R3264_13235, partial [Anaerolineae bacterium]|nr:hypothetical protein [Anaerolineae bacterium]